MCLNISALCCLSIRIVRCFMNAPLLVVTVDVEEDGWGQFTPRSVEASNLRLLPELHRQFQALGIRPTYLTTHVAGGSDEGRSALEDILSSSESELGAHLHPWNTPPLQGNASESESMACNLQGTVLYDKLSTLTELLSKTYQRPVSSFRAGRWGMGAELVRVLESLRYRVDSSIAPFVNWEEYTGPNYSHLPYHDYWPSVGRLLDVESSTVLSELPPTVSYLQTNAERAHQLFEWSGKPLFRPIHLRGILSRMGVVNRVWLSPEINKQEEILQLAKRLLQSGVRVLNFTFHSPSLSPGLTPFVKSKSDAAAFEARLFGSLEKILSLGTEPKTLSEADEILRNRAVS